MISEIERSQADGDGAGVTKPSAPILYERGMEVGYRTRDGSTTPARILEVHYDDVLVPYYTILREDGSEKQTDGDHLSPLLPQVGVGSSTGAETGVCDATEDGRAATENLKPPSSGRRPGDVVVSRPEGGVSVKTSDEQREKRKKKGRCPTCGEVRTHKRGPRRIWIPDTADGLVYNGVCLKCNTLDAAKIMHGELADGPGALCRSSVTQLQLAVASGAQNGDGSSARKRGNYADAVISRSVVGLSADSLGQTRHCNTLDAAKVNSGELGGSDTLCTSSNKQLQHAPSSGAQNAGRRSPRVRGNHTGSKLRHSMISLPAESPSQTRRGGGHPGRSRVSASSFDCVDRLSPADTPSKQAAASINIEEKNERKAAQSLEVVAMSKLSGAPAQLATFGECPGHVSEPDDENRHTASPQQQYFPDHAHSKKPEDPLHRSPLKKSEDPLRRHLTLSITEPDSTLASRNTSIHEELKCSIVLLGLAKKEARGFHHGDSDGDSVYDAGDNAKDRPCERGMTIVDDGGIMKGGPPEGTSGAGAPPARRRHQPYLLPGYAVGDKGRGGDMMKATIDTVSRLRVGDCAFVRRSDSKKSWSYALVKTRSYGDDASITFQVKKGSTKTIRTAQWAGHIRLPIRPKPDGLPGYRVGDPGREEDMNIASQEETLLSLSKLRVDDAAFVQRSSGVWVYAVVNKRTDGDNARITFEINPEGSTKSAQISQCGRFVRRVRRRPISSNDGANLTPPSTCEAKPSARQTRRATTAEVHVEKGVSKSPASDGSTKIKRPCSDADQQQQPVKSSLSPLEESQEEPDQRCKEGFICPTDQSASSEVHDRSFRGQLFDCHENDVDKKHQQSSTYLPAIYNKHHPGADDDKSFTDCMGSYSSECSSLTSSSDKSQRGIQSKDVMQMSIIALRRRRAPMGDGIDGSLTESLIRNMACDDSLKQSWEAFKKTRKKNCNKTELMDEKRDLADEKRSFLTYESKPNEKACAKDEMPMSLISQASTEDVMNGDAGDGTSFDGTLTNLKESFVEWRKQEKMRESRGEI